jgi:hypothetical protein
MRRHQQKLFWLLALLLLWLFCSGTAQAGELAERLSRFPEWQGKPFVQPAKGDLIYPEWFAGEWLVTTTLVEMEAPLAPELTTPGFESNRKFLNQPIAFSVRFVEEQPDGIQMFLQPLLNPLLDHSAKSIVSDRAFNGLSLARAYLGNDAVVWVKVDPHNPNRQVTLLKDDRRLLSTVTARDTESPNPNQFITTEIFQQEFLGLPDIYFNEVENTTAYTYYPESVNPESVNSEFVTDSADSATSTTLEANIKIAGAHNNRINLDRANPDHPDIIANQVTAIYLSPQDPDYFKTFPTDNLFASSRPVALYRYHMEFHRVTSKQPA